MPAPPEDDVPGPDGDDAAGGDHAIERESPGTAPPTTSRTDGHRGPASRPALLAAVVGGLLLVALVLVVTQREPAQLPPDSPQATVQAFLQSIVDGAPDTSLLAPDTCPGGVDTHFHDDDRLRATVVESATDGDLAEVTLSITEFHGSGVIDDGYQHDETYRLARTADGWRITGFDWPFDACWNGLGTDLPGDRPTSTPRPDTTVPGTTGTDKADPPADDAQTDGEVDA